ncbi:helix-turn-helix transcriptional regulator [Cyanobacterium aponinum]|uniref:Uncharacterized protein n=1 Tax=Cyanobacterium aponinum 0216 TaxID=2676140 RepID=A0A844GVF6_9CHRO|nr:helix-turn-helix transcriptional regulator [Cyanobacterium aponinum]MTF38848.1 hypothetical protein [Cyanobacterium aponinum 0216]
MTQDTTKEIQTLENRSKKNRWLVGILFLISPVGYFYTNRYLLAIITTIIYFILVTTVEEYEAISILWLLFIIGITVENITSINNAKEKVKFLQGNSPQSGNNASNPNLMILKALENNGEMTASQIILATELTPQIVKETLFTLEQEQLVYGYNREDDGVIVYKNT